MSALLRQFFAGLPKQDTPKTPIGTAPVPEPVTASKRPPLLKRPEPATVPPAGAPVRRPSLLGRL